MPVEVIIRLFLRLFTLRYLVALFVHSHIRSKLQQLSAAYIRQSQTLTWEASDSNDRQWCGEMADACDRFASTLRSWRSVRGVVSVSLPVVVGLVVAGAGSENIYQVAIDFIQQAQLPSLVFLATVVGFPVAYLFFFVNTAFERKRALFLPSSASLLAFIMPETDNPRNVYESENRVFALLGTKKSREFPIDIITYASSFALLGTALFVSSFTSLHGFMFVLGLVEGAGFGVGGLCIAAWSMGARWYQR